MTYTTVHKDYEADTFPLAWAAMAFDTDIWKLVGTTPDGVDATFDEAVLYRAVAGENTNYLVESWRWDVERKVLRVHFR